MYESAAQAFNRTNLELKRIPIDSPYHLHETFNRTNLELKHHRDVNMEFDYWKAFNRTNLELKPLCYGL